MHLLPYPLGVFEISNQPLLFVRHLVSLIEDDKLIYSLEISYLDNCLDNYSRLTIHFLADMPFLSCRWPSPLLCHHDINPSPSPVNLPIFQSQSNSIN